MPENYRNASASLYYDQWGHIFKIRVSDILRDQTLHQGRQQ